MERKGFSGSALKMIAIATMLIDHIAATVIIRVLKFGGYNDSLYQLYRVMRNIGRIAFPIFCWWKDLCTRETGKNMRCV